MTTSAQGGTQPGAAWSWVLLPTPAGLAGTGMSMMLPNGDRNTIPCSFSCASESLGTFPVMGCTNGPCSCGGGSPRATPLDAALWVLGTSAPGSSGQVLIELRALGQAPRRELRPETCGETRLSSESSATAAVCGSGPHRQTLRRSAGALRRVRGSPRWVRGSCPSGRRFDRPDEWNQPAWGPRLSGPTCTTLASALPAHHGPGLGPAGRATRGRGEAPACSMPRCTGPSMKTPCTASRIGSWLAAAHCGRSSLPRRVRPKYVLIWAALAVQLKFQKSMHSAK
mmetsp:Transcript_103783/g.293406  ORF Transcript_103783/g.293406 Transcript_103783/m.293406 type:complete len:283 (-) Transcript_103783:80-928(-)